jgi:hypothetical protein
MFPGLAKTASSGSMKAVKGSAASAISARAAKEWACPSLSHWRLHSWISHRPAIFFRKRTVLFTPSSLQKPNESAS